MRLFQKVSEAPTRPQPAAPRKSFILLPLLNFAVRKRGLLVGGPGRGKTASALMGILAGYFLREVRISLREVRHLVILTGARDPCLDPRLAEQVRRAPSLQRCEVFLKDDPQLYPSIPTPHVTRVLAER